MSGDWNVDARESLESMRKAGEATLWNLLRARWGGTSDGEVGGLSCSETLPGKGNIFQCPGASESQQLCALGAPSGELGFRWCRASSSSLLLPCGIEGEDIVHICPQPRNKQFLLLFLVERARKPDGA